MSRKYKFHDPEGAYFITFAVTEWVDVFTRKCYRDIVLDSLSHCQRVKGLEVYAWCLMSNHIHLLARATKQDPLPDIMRDLKKYTSKQIYAAIKENPRESRRKWMLQQFQTSQGFRFWRAGNHPIQVWSDHVVRQKLNYIHNNPVEAGIVGFPEHYLYSSARDYSGEKGLLEVVRVV
jgi:REP element-mobilizing transposase RayT